MDLYNVVKITLSGGSMSNVLLEFKIALWNLIISTIDDKCIPIKVMHIYTLDIQTLSQRKWKSITQWWTS